MKLMFFIMSFSCLFNADILQEDIAEVTNLVHAFSKSGDERNVVKLEKILHKDYRAIVNQAFGSSEIQFMDKATYLDLLKKKAIGGDTRSVTILSIEMEENNAIVKAKFAGKALIFTTFMQMVKNSEGEWKVMSDLPVIQKVKN